MSTPAAESYERMRGNQPQIPFVPWDEFVGEHFRWYQGEHVAAIAPTNGGKTTLMTALLPFRKYVVFVATKPRDTTADRLLSQGFVKFEKWEKYDPRVYPKRLLWPNISKLGMVGAQRREIGKALQAIYVEGHWCVVIDELWYLIHQLQLEKTIRTYLTQARSLGISLAVCTQRPAFVPLEVYDQSTHLFFGRDNDERNLKRISGISWLSSRTIMREIANLPKWHFLYICTRTGAMVKTIAPVEASQ